jgi:glutamate-ammonia-ligase adenylyltransferase
MTIISHLGRLILTKDLPEISQYSNLEIAKAEEFSPALKTYLSLLARPQLNLKPRDELRIRRHQVWCQAVLATFHERASTEEICYKWSLTAEQLIGDAWNLAGGSAEGLIILALGKLGSRELNLSSDVDLVFVRRDDQLIDVNVMKAFNAILNERDEFGYALRVDLNLRPGGRSGSLLTSQTEFEYHYGYHGEMWERLSYVRARFIFGDPKLAEEILKFANRFSYRKHIDLTLMDDLSSLRQKIHHDIGLKDQSFFNLKLSPGGIRDLELFVHSLQLIHGGKNKSLQTQSTSEAIAQLAALSFISAEEAKFLLSSYWYFRNVENHLHGTDDRQTYAISKKQKIFSKFAVECILNLADKSEEFVSRLLKINDEPALATDIDDQKKWLKEKGFSEASINEIWPKIISASALSLKSEKDEVARQRFLHSFVDHLSNIQRNKDFALALLSDFIFASRAKASLYSLLNREKKLTEEIAWLFSSSPYLANIFVMRPELIDSLFFKSQAELPQDQDEALEMLIERRLLVEILCAQKFLKDLELGSLSLELTNTADEICKILLGRLTHELQSESLNIICLGKWGGRELGFRSDLDFIFVTDETPTPIQQKLSKRFIHWLNQPNRGGVIYNIDTRLRPNGQAGPLLVSQAQLKNFLQHSAEAWQRQAYLKARPLFDLNFSIPQCSSQKLLSPTEREVLTDIRKKLLNDDSDSYDLKLRSGGLVDIEFAAQVSLLERAQFSLDSSTQGMIQYNMSQDEGWKLCGAQLLQNYNFLRTVEQMHQLTSSQSHSKIKKSQQAQSAFAVLATNLNLDIEQFDLKLQNIFSENRALLTQLRGDV